MTRRTRAAAAAAALTGLPSHEFSQLLSSVITFLTFISGLAAIISPAG